MAKRKNQMMASLLYIVIGVLFVVFRVNTLHWMMTAVGLAFVIAGAVDLSKRSNISGIASLAIGVAVLILGWVATQIVLVVLGCLLALKGLLALAEAIRRKKSAFEIFISAVTLALGVLLALGNAMEILVLIVGILLIADGILGVISAAKR